MGDKTDSVQRRYNSVGRVKATPQNHGEPHGSTQRHIELALWPFLSIKLESNGLTCPVCMFAERGWLVFSCTRHHAFVVSRVVCCTGVHGELPQGPGG